VFVFVCAREQEKAARIRQLKDLRQTYVGKIMEIKSNVQVGQAEGLEVFKEFCRLGTTKAVIK